MGIVSRLTHAPVGNLGLGEPLCGVGVQVQNAVRTFTGFLRNPGVLRECSNEMRSSFYPKSDRCRICLVEVVVILICGRTLGTD